MPTGYTAGVANGTITTLRQYAMTCARAMGVLVHMRDEPMDAPIPEKIEPNDYHMKRLAEAEAEFKRVSKMSDEECEIEAKKDYLERVKYSEDYASEQAATLKRYKDMYSRVINLRNAPIGLADFMSSQLDDSIRFDTYNDRVVIMEDTGTDWYENKIITLLRDISYHSDMAAKEIKRASEATAWLKQLRDCLDEYEARE